MRLVVLSFLLLLAGCKTYHANEAMKVDQIAGRKLPSLEAVYENVKSIKKESNSGSLHRINDNYATVFYREVEKNIAEEEGDKKGRIVLTPIYLETEKQKGFAIVSALTLGLANLVGVPRAEYEATAELELRILDSKGNVIKKYASERTVSEYVAIGGYKASSVKEASKMSAYKSALRDITYQIQNDYDYLKQKLK